MIIKTVHKTAWMIGGVIFLLLAIIGLLLPIVPQLIFFVLSMVCFLRCSDRLNEWISHQHWFAHLHAWAQKKHWFKYIQEHLPHPKHKKHDPSNVD